MSKKFPTIPRKDAEEVLNKKIRDLYSLDYSMNQIAEMLSVSKKTVFLALKGRAKKVVKNNK